LLILVGAALTGAITGFSNPDQPNVMMIVTNDHGYGYIASHGHPRLKTPNIGHLREMSVRLTDFHDDPICARLRIGDQIDERLEVTLRATGVRFECDLQVGDAEVQTWLT
jgi:hypothetical protein